MPRCLLKFATKTNMSTSHMLISLSELINVFLLCVSLGFFVSENQLIVVCTDTTLKKTYELFVLYQI